MSFIPVNTPSLSGNEKKYLNECIDTGWISSEGPFIKKFEEELAKKVGRKHGIAVCNGSVAIDAAIVALGIKDGDEVIMPTFTIISCVAAVLRAGGVPIFVDSDAATWNMDTTQIEQKITSRTKAIMVVHIYGLPVEMDNVLAISKKYDLKVIEDAAEMHGQTYKGKMCGSFGDISTFSFYPNKHITTGEGGMIMTDDDALAEKCRSLRNLCFIPEKRFVHYELGWNFRMTNLQAALGVAQLEQLDNFVIKKRALGAKYNAAFAQFSDVVQLPLDSTAYAQNIYWVYGMVLKNNAINADQAIKQLAKLGIGTRPFFWCMHEQPLFNKQGKYLNEKYPVAENMARQGFYIPSGLGLTDEESDIVIEKVSQFLESIR